MHYVNIVRQEQRDQDEIPKAIYGSPEFVEEVQKLCGKYHVFSKKLRTTPAQVTAYSMEIEKDEWEQGRNRGKARSLGRQKDAIMKLFVKALLEAGVIEESSEAVYHSYAHLVPKGTLTKYMIEGKTPEELVEHYRMVIDSRALNKATKRTLEFPMPTVKTLMGDISGERNECFSKFDLTKGYWQVELDRNSRVYTAFMTSEGVYQWVRLPMGLRGAPSHFQHLMRTQILKGIWKRGLHAYMDDILLGTRTEAEMLQRLEELFRTLEKFNVTLNPDKTQIGLKEVEFIGHTISKDGITFSREKIAHVIAQEKPEFDVQLKSFVGLVNYFASHIKNFSTVMAPLNKLLVGYVKRRPKRVQWTKESSDTFDNLKHIMNEIPVLFFPTADGEVVVETDASDYGIGGWCYQIVKETDAEGNVTEVKKPVAFVSQALQASQYKWSVPMKEAYAVNIVLQKLDYLLCGVRFRLRTDHKNLIYIKEAKDDMVQRWKMRIQHYDCDVEHVPGEENEVADGLSRMVNVKMTSEQVVHLIDNYLIPEDIEELIGLCHNDEIGHSGVEPTFARLVQLMFERGIVGKKARIHVRRYIRRCPVCQRNQLNRMLALSETFTVEAYEPWERSAWDMIKALPDDGYGNTMLLVGVDCLTRFVVLYPMKEGTAHEVARKMLVNASMFGATCQILVDNGSEFANEVVRELNDMLGTEVVHTVPYSHQQNAIVERVNKEIMRWIRDRFVNNDEKMKWGDWYPLIGRALNGSVGFSCGVAPAKMLFGNMIDMDRALLRVPNTTGTVVKVSEYMKNLLVVQEKILTAVKLRQEDKIKHKDLERNPEAIRTDKPGRSDKLSTGIDRIAISKGDYVLVGYDPSSKVAAKAKYRANLRGPYEVLSVVTSNVTVTDGRREFTVPAQWCSHYLFTPDMDPVIESLRGTRYQVIDQVISHRGGTKPKDMEFLVRWVGMEETDDTWCTYESLSWSHKFHEYCAKNKLKALIPVRFNKEAHYSTARVAVRDPSKGVVEEVVNQQERFKEIEGFFGELKQQSNKAPMGSKDGDSVLTVPNRESTKGIKRKVGSKPRDHHIGVEPMSRRTRSMDKSDRT